MTIFEGAVVHEEEGELFRTLATTEALARRECHTYLDEACGPGEWNDSTQTITITEWKVVTE